MQATITTKRLGTNRSKATLTLVILSISSLMAGGAAISFMSDDTSSVHTHTIAPHGLTHAVGDWSAIALDRNGADVVAGHPANGPDGTQLLLDRNGADVITVQTSQAQDVTGLVLDRHGADVPVDGILSGSSPRSYQTTSHRRVMDMHQQPSDDQQNLPPSADRRVRRY